MYPPPSGSLNDPVRVAVPFSSIGVVTAKSPKLGAANTVEVLTANIANIAMKATAITNLPLIAVLVNIFLSFPLSNFPSLLIVLTVVQFRCMVRNLPQISECLQDPGLGTATGDTIHPRVKALLCSLFLVDEYWSFQCSIFESVID